MAALNFETVRDVIVETLSCDAAEVTLEARLTEELGADSLAAVELSMALEETFSVSIADEDLAGLKTVGDIMAYLTGHAV